EEARFRTIVADPPWPLKWSGGTRTAGRSAASPDAPCMNRQYVIKPMPYPTMTVDEIASLSVAERTDANATLFLWTLDRFVMDGSAARVARAWGFEPLPHLLVWHKPSAGLGQFFRPAHELILVGK